MFRKPELRPSRVYLSPHCDDAVLSCGGAIAAAAGRGERVLVITVCAGAPPPGTPLGPFIQALLAAWGFPDPAACAAARRAEDLAAVRAVGAEVIWLDLVDAVYRDPVAYGGERGPFREPAPGDPLCAGLGRALGELLAPWPGVPLYAPLGVGMHADHLAAHEAAAVLGGGGRAVLFYEDVPYAFDAGAVEARLRQLPGLRPSVEPLDAAALARKIEGVACYASQLVTLFGDAGAMGEALARHAAGRAAGGAAYGEQLWRA